MAKKHEDRVTDNIKLRQAYDRDLADTVRDIKELEKQLKADEKSREGLEKERDGLIKKKEALQEQLAELKKLDKEIDEKKAEQKEAQGKEKAAIGVEIKALEAKAKKLGGDPSKVEAELKANEKELKKNDTEWEKFVKYSEGYLEKKKAAEKFREELLLKQKAAEEEARLLVRDEEIVREIDAMTYESILEDKDLREQFAKLTYNESTINFLDEMKKKGNRGNLATYNKYIKTDEINLQPGGDLLQRFRTFAAQGDQADWGGDESRKLWAEAVEVTLRVFKQDRSSLKNFKEKFKEQLDVI